MCPTQHSSLRLLPHCGGLLGCVVLLGFGSAASCCSAVVASSSACSSSACSSSACSSSACSSSACRSAVGGGPVSSSQLHTCLFLIEFGLNHPRYASRATPKDFEIYAPNATFEDPLMRAHGVKQIKSAFYSLSKIFSESRIVDYTITEKETSPGKTEILIDNKQYYKFLGRDINMISLIKLDTEDGKVVAHQDRWDKKPLWDRETVKAPLMGHVIEATRRASMLATHALMRFGKDP
ncbi:hypothetical protein SASPL_102452 [Salvia splendens]|uniref:SnoaL-like domain-containing protein n=1 Tax=Salvia splendens TaxID=180675 RepID=A0A8X9ADD0_SALSN|nr:hypothetical protein SASPL_102452 [Salvia splendens]